MWSGENHLRANDDSGAEAVLLPFLKVLTSTAFASASSAGVVIRSTDDVFFDLRYLVRVIAACQHRVGSSRQQNCSAKQLMSELRENALSHAAVATKFRKWCERPRNQAVRPVSQLEFDLPQLHRKMNLVWGHDAHALRGPTRNPQVTALTDRELAAVVISISSDAKFVFADGEPI